MTAVAQPDRPPVMTPQQRAPRHAYQQERAKCVQDLAWKLDRELTELGEGEYPDSLRRIRGAVHCLKTMDWGDYEEPAQAHRALVRALAAQIRDWGYTQVTATQLVYELYFYLEDAHCMRRRRKDGVWEATDLTKALDVSFLSEQSRRAES
jgi:hypothetical protein